MSNNKRFTYLLTYHGELVHPVGSSVHQRQLNLAPCCRLSCCSQTLHILRQLGRNYMDNEAYVSLLVCTLTIRKLAADSQTKP